MKTSLSFALAALLVSALPAQTVTFSPVPPELGEGLAARVFAARVRLADDEVLVVREIARTVDGRVDLADTVVAAKGREAEFRIVMEPDGTRGTKVRHGPSELLLGHGEAMQTIAKASHLELRANGASVGIKSFAWFARVEKASEFARRRPGYQRPQHDHDGWSSVARYAVLAGQ